MTRNHGARGCAHTCRRPARPTILAGLLVLAAALVLAPFPATIGFAGPGGAGAVATGRGGAAASADEHATRAALEMLAKGGNAVDAAVAAAAVLGVTKPFWCGIGGGGFMVIYLASEHRVVTVDHDGTAPHAVTATYWLGPNGRPLPYAEAITGGIAPTVPGAVLGWEEALHRYGHLTLSEVLAPAIRVAEQGFPRDAEFVGLTRSNANRLRAFGASRQLFLTPAGDVPPVGSPYRNPDLARAYRLIALEGSRAVYRGPIGWAIVHSVQQPPVVPGFTGPVHPGVMTLADLSDYEVRVRAPVVTTYRGYTVYGMGLPSAGGTAVALALNILAGFDLGALPRAQALHDEMETARLIFADRRAYLGDPDFVRVPTAGLLSAGYAAERRARIGADAAPGTVLPGNPIPFQPAAERTGGARPADTSAEGTSTTHLTVADREGNVVSYTYTLGEGFGNAAVVPGFGFVLNTGLADFSTTPGSPNAPAGGKRPLSTMSPTIVVKGAQPVLALGSPGGSTIVTTVLELLVDTLDFGMDLPSAIAAPRYYQDSSPVAQGEAEFLAEPEAQALTQLGHRFVHVGAFGIGAASGIAFHPDGTVTAAAEPVRRSGGSAMVERPLGP